MLTNPADVEIDSDESDEFQTLLASIAEGISELSKLENLPQGFTTYRGEIDFNDVNFVTGSWVLKLSEVQGWLKSDNSLSERKLNADCYKNLIEFFEGIGDSNPEASLEKSGSIVMLTPTGAACLSNRLDTARKLQEGFQADFENYGVVEATKNWLDRWDEQIAQDTFDSDKPISAEVKTWEILTFKSKAVGGNLNLNPSYQRGDVWTTNDSQQLVESILRGIPLPTIILLKDDKEKTYERYEVVDGKQRLTAILRFMGQHPKAVERVKKLDKQHPDKGFLRLFEDDYGKFKRLYKNVVNETLTEKREAEYYFPFRVSANSKGLSGERYARLRGEYYSSIKNQCVLIGNNQPTIKDVFEVGGSGYLVPTIVFQRSTSSQIHQVFSLYNKQGKHLNPEELRNAVFHELKLVRLLLVASGDNPDAASLAPYLSADRVQYCRTIASILGRDGYSIGEVGYKRTKILSWLLATLFLPSVRDGRMIVRSTANQINGFFQSIQSDEQKGKVPLLENEGVLSTLVTDLATCLEAHSSSICWDDRFKDGDVGSRWQELPLIATLTGVFLLTVMSTDALGALDSNEDTLRKFTRDNPRDRKSQNKTQWRFIGKTALGMIDILGIDRQALQRKLIERYGVSCVETLVAAADISVE